MGAYGGTRVIMDMVAPSGGVYQAGTLSGNPVAMTAGIATLNAIKKFKIYKPLERRTLKIKDELEGRIKVSAIGSMFSLFF